MSLASKVAYSKLLLDVKYPKVLLALLALLFISGGSWCYFNYSYILLTGLKDQLQLTNSTLHSQNWWRTNETTYLNVSILNYTKSQDKQLQGHSVGPYVFKLTHERRPERSPVDLVAKLDGQDVIRYQQIDHLTFQVDRSSGLLGDAIVTPSVAAIHAKNLLLRSNLGEKLRNELEMALNDTGHSLYKETTVEKLLLDGRRSKLMSIINSGNESILNGLVPYRRKSVTNYVINSGKNESNLIASIEYIDGQRVNRKEARDGHQFKPGIKKDQLLTFLEPSLCIFGQLRYERSMEENGNKIYQFKLQSDSSDEQWPASHLAACQSGLPVKHRVDPLSSKFKVEPISGIVIESMVTYESVAVLEQHKGSGDCEAKELPLIQVAKVSQVSKDIEEEVTNEITRNSWVYQSIAICLMAVGGMCLLGSCFVWYRQRTRKKLAEEEASREMELILSEFDDL